MELGGRTTAASIARSALAVVLLGALLAAHTAEAASTTVQGAFNGRQPETSSRVARDGTATACPLEPYPGTFDGQSFYQAFTFCNGDADTCYTATYDPGTCGDEVHLLAYTNFFDPNNLPANYAGDIGGSNLFTFSFPVPAGLHFQIVAQTNFGMAECTYGFTIDAMRCVAPAPALSESALALAACVLLLIAAAAMRRSRAGMIALVLCAMLAGLGGIAAAPIAADPTPGAARACGLSCSAEYRRCAEEKCDSGAWDKNPECLSECRRSYDSCRSACPAD